MRPEPHEVAARLGLDATTIRRLEACGYLSRLALMEAEISERLYRAHLRYVQSAGHEGSRASGAHHPPTHARSDGNNVEALYRNVGNDGHGASPTLR
jgi:hypothetical protein